MSSERAEQDYGARVKMHRTLDKAVGGDGYTAEVAENNTLGQNILREELGYFGPYDGPRYSLDEATRNLLIAHTRQDVAATYAFASSAFREAHITKKIANRAALYALGALVLNLTTLVTLLFM